MVLQDMVAVTLQCSLLIYSSASCAVLLTDTEYLRCDAGFILGFLLSIFTLLYMPREGFFSRM